MATVTERVERVSLAADTEQITRFDIHQRIQHAGMMVSFILLVLSGLPLKFNRFAISQWWTGLWGGVEATRSVHHFAAWGIVVVCIYHVIYLCYTMGVQKRPFPVKMVPSLQDLRNIITEMLYFAGLRKDRPSYDRFNWREKFDYWAIFWGMPVMAISGFIMMYPVMATRIIPGWVVPTALVAHSDEAMLALTWIAMIHIFFNHFSPGIFPMNKSIFTGRVPKDRYREEHTLEYERVYAADEPVDLAADLSEELSADEPNEAKEKA